jgi:hypothetical protein
MAPLSAEEQAGIVQGSVLGTKYGQAVDRESAHEIISARLGRAKETAALGKGAATNGAGPADTTPMSDAEMEREIKRRARELEAERRAAERERKAEERARRADERQRQKTLETGIRTAGRVVTSRAGQSLIRGIFETLFGKRR